MVSGLISPPGSLGVFSPCRFLNKGAFTGQTARLQVQVVCKRYGADWGVNETSLYNTAGTIVSTTDDGTNKTATVEWNLSQALTQVLTFKPQVEFLHPNLTGGSTMPLRTSLCPRF